MKNWNSPAIVELAVSNTEQGHNLTKDYDEVRVDQNGNYWFGCVSGADSKPETDGEVIVQ